MEGQQIRSIPVTTLAFTNSDSHHHYRTPGMTATISAVVSFFFCLMIRASGCCFFTVVFRGQKGWSYEGVWVRKVVMFAFIHVGSCLSFKNVRECRCILKCWRQIFLDVYLQVGLEGGGRMGWGVGVVERFYFNRHQENVTSICVLFSLSGIFGSNKVD